MNRGIGLGMLLLALSLPGCARTPMRTGGPLPPTLQTCNAEAVQGEVGQPATAERIERIRVGSASTLARVLHPGQMVTMEFSGERVNVRVDEKNVIVAVNCG